MAERASGFETLRRGCAAALRGEAGAVVPEDGFTEHGLALAERHRVVPLVAEGLTAAGREPLRRRVLALAQQTVRLEQELAAIARIWSTAGVEFLVMKGPALARQAYPVPEVRAYDDLDLWVATDDFDRAVRALETEGYRRSQPLGPRAAACARRAGIEAGLVHPDRGRLVEVAHGWRALAPTRSAAEEIIARSVVLEIAGGRIRAPAISRTTDRAMISDAARRVGASARPPCATSTRRPRPGCTSPASIPARRAHAATRGPSGCMRR